jgi:hypothetical protein
MSRKSKVFEDLFIIAFLIFGMGWTPYVWTRMVFAVVLLLFIFQKVLLWAIDEYRRLRAR